MLISLTIRDFALIEQLETAFGPGLNILTGETGAGKSILIDAMGLVLGDRADTAAIRSGAAKTVVEALFENVSLPALDALLAGAQIELQPQLILRREVSAKGQSRCFVNDTPVSVATLKAVGDLLVDVHGQHEHQSLLHPETHIEILDAYGGLEKPLEEYREAYGRFREKIAARGELIARRRNIDERRAVVEYQLREIDKVGPRGSEDEEIERELRVAEHAERIALLSSEIVGGLYDGEGAALELIARAERSMEELARIDASLDPLRAELNSTRAALEELVRSVRQYAERVEFDPSRIESMRQRLNLLVGLKRRFGASLEEIAARGEELRKEYGSMDSLDDRIGVLEKEIGSLRKECARRAATLSQKRAAAADKLGREVEAILRELAIAHPAFRSGIGARKWNGGEDLLFLERDGEKVAPDERGWDQVEFQLSTNVGEAPKPLAKVVSGGEVSRVMLAIKSILARHDRVPLLVFDEIDTGVSGRIAQKVGSAMKKLSRHHQIVAITHLPQIAALADTHLAVEKSAQGGRARTSVRALDPREREFEVARLLGGEEVTKSNLASARELMKEE